MHLEERGKGRATGASKCTAQHSRAGGRAKGSLRRTSETKKTQRTKSGGLRLAACGPHFLPASFLTLDSSIFDLSDSGPPAGWRSASSLKLSSPRTCTPQILPLPGRRPAEIIQTCFAAESLPYCAVTVRDAAGGLPALEFSAARTMSRLCVAEISFARRKVLAVRVTAAT